MRISMVPVWVRQHRPKVTEVQIEYPMIALKDWATYMLNSNQSSFLLGGYDIKDVDGYSRMYLEFWHRYRELDSTHPFFEHHPPDEWGRCIPYLLHGDEGRGKSKVPILVQSFQMLIAPTGIESTNISGQLGCIEQAFFPG